MRFGADEYYHASQERMRQARQLHERGSNYALAMYCAGLAVECMLRALRWQVDSSFEGRHDIVELFRASRFLRVDEDYMKSKGETEEAIDESARHIRAQLNEVAALWNNNLRFASEKKLKNHLRDIDRLQGIRGDPLKKNSADLLEASQAIVTRGIALWI